MPGGRAGMTLRQLTLFAYWGDAAYGQVAHSRVDAIRADNQVVIAG